MKNNKPFTFLFYNHKTKNTSEPQIKIPNNLIKILKCHLYIRVLNTVIFIWLSIQTKLF